MELLNFFSLTTPDELSSLARSSRKTYSPLNFFLSRLISVFLPTLLPHLVNFFLILPLFSGITSVKFKSAAVRPPLIKPKLDPNIQASFQPIALLPLFSKILRCLVTLNSLIIITYQIQMNNFNPGLRVVTVPKL